MSPRESVVFAVPSSILHTSTVTLILIRSNGLVLHDSSSLAVIDNTTYNGPKLATKERRPSHETESIAVIIFPPGLMSSAPVHTTVIFKRREQVITILSQIGFDQKKR